MIERRRSTPNLHFSSFLENITVVLETKHGVRTDSTSPLSFHSLCFDERIQSMVRLRVVQFLSLPDATVAYGVTKLKLRGF
jgi:hypothetical protein